MPRPAGGGEQEVISSAPMPGVVLSLAFFLSGAAGLMFQIVWFHRAGPVFGSGVSSVTAVLSAFMAGD
jgi:hypothetical protein